MRHDARKLDQGPSHRELECDLCIVGAGPAGLVLAREFEGSGVRVCLLESGGIRPSPRLQALNAGRSLGLVGDDYLQQSRLRQLGGTSNHWNGWCAPLDEQDFEARPWIPHSGWPFSRTALLPYYRRAQEICGLGPFDYSFERWYPDHPGAATFLEGAFENRIWQIRPLRFGAKYLVDLERSRNLELYLHASVTGLRAHRDGRHVEALEASTLDGKRLRVRARRVVLACGGIENARMLLLSNDAVTPGLGNQRDLVGRFFMDHPERHAGEVMFLEPGALQSYSSMRQHGGFSSYLSLGVRSELRRKRELLDGSLTIVQPSATTDAFDIGVHHAARTLEGRSGSDATSLSQLFVRAEQSPNPDSRVRLGTDTDALGLRRVVLDWQLARRDRDSIRQTLRWFSEELGSRGLGRIRLRPWLREGEETWPLEEMGPGYHHMGTTRMHPDPGQGVVDADCRVHGVDNLFVAGSSVFPTAGWANPTLTLVALTLRLADHLKSRG